MAKIEAFYGEFRPGMVLADLHIHGEEDDGRLGIERMVRSAQDRGLHAIGVTLHDNYAFGDRVREYVERNNIKLRVHPGSEVTAKGEDGEDVHILAYETDGEIEMYQSVPDTLEDIEKRKGFAAIAHPDSGIGGSARMAQVLSWGIPVHIEVFNGAVHQKHRVKSMLGMTSVDSNETTKEFYQANQALLGAVIGGSDAHKFKLGVGMTAYEGELRDALRERQTVVVFRDEIEVWWPWDVRTHHRKLATLSEKRAMRYNEMKAAVNSVVMVSGVLQDVA